MPCGLILVQFKDIYMYAFEIQPFITTFLFYSIVVQSHSDAIGIFVSHIVNPSTLKNKFITLVEYIEYKLLKLDNKKLEAQWWQDCEKKIAQYVGKKMHDFDGIVVPKVERRKWACWHPFLTSSQ
jgi:hypothetical protein